MDTSEQRNAIRDRWVNSTWPQHNLDNGFNDRLTFFTGLFLSRVQRGLFAIACCHEASRPGQKDADSCEHALSVIENYMRGLASPSSLQSALRQIPDDRMSQATEHGNHNRNSAVRATGRYARASSVADVIQATYRSFWSYVWTRYPVAEVVSRCKVRQGSILASFCVNSEDPSWKTPEAVGVARAIYDSRDYGAAPVLADALQDAGCEDPGLLDTLRDTSIPLYRGAAILDYLLSP